MAIVPMAKPTLTTAAATIGSRHRPLLASPALRRRTRWTGSAPPVQPCIGSPTCLPSADCTNSRCTDGGPARAGWLGERLWMPVGGGITGHQDLPVGGQL